MKYIDAEKLKAELRRQKYELELSIQSQGDYGQSCHIVAYENIISLIDSLLDSLQQEQPEVDLEQEVISYFQGMWPGIDSNMPMKFMPPAIMRLVKHFYELGKAANPKVMQEVSDNVDKLRAISTPAEEDWFKISEEWEKEDKMGKKGKVHGLKILPEYFRSVKSGEKTFEVRFNDRNFQQGDILHLREWDGNGYTGESIFVEVSYIFENPDYCKDGYVIMAIRKMEDEKSVTDCDELEKAADDHIRNVADAAGHPGWDWTTQDIADAFKAGAKWQYQKDRYEFAKLKAKEWCNGYDAALSQFVKIPYEPRDWFKVAEEWEKEDKKSATLRDELIESSRALYYDIDRCITDLLMARFDKDEQHERKALSRMESLMVATQQQLCCITDYLSKEDK